MTVIRQQDERYLALDFVVVLFGVLAARLVDGLREDAEQLEREINRFAYSEVFQAPERRATAIATSERLMEQGVAWASAAVPQYKEFLSGADTTEGR